jgi:hypothetical protein
LNPLTTSKMKISVTAVNSDLTVNSSQKTSNLELTWLESDKEPTTIVMEYVLIFPTVTCTPRYDKQFRSYHFWKWTEQLKFNYGQNGVTWVIRSLDHLRNGNPVNTENQSRRYFLKFPTHTYTTYSGKQNQGKHIRFWSKGKILFEN